MCFFVYRLTFVLFGNIIFLPFIGSNRIDNKNITVLDYTGGHLPESQAKKLYGGIRMLWQVSTGFIVQSAFLAVALIFVGYLAYHEALTWNKLVGVAVCLVGLVFINLK